MNTKRIFLIPAVAAFLAATAAAPVFADERELVEMPPPMQAHMLSNMRDHLLALDEVLAALADGDTATAAKVAEERIGMSSLTLHGAEHMAPFMPEGMRAAGTELHHASSRFAVAAENAALEHTFEAQQKVFAALQEMTAACNACHTAYRIR